MKNEKYINPGGPFPITTGQPQIKWYNCPPHYSYKPLISFMFLDLIRLHQLFAFNSLPMARKTLASIMRRTLARLTICHKSHNYLRLCPFHSRSEQRVIQDKVNVHTCIINCKDSLSLRTRKMNELTTQKSVKQTDRQTERQSFRPSLSHKLAQFTAKMKWFSLLQSEYFTISYQDLFTPVPICKLSDDENDKDERSYEDDDDDD